MSAIITSNFRSHIVRQFVEAFTEPSPTNLYLFIGRPYSWATDTDPDTPFDSESNMSAIWDDMMSLKRIQASDIKPGITRRNWASGTVYDEYRHNYSTSNPSYSGATNLYDSKFYVVSDDLKVYKCIFNNKNAPSTIQPTGTSLQIFTTSDGYRWKYMYSVTTSDAEKFASSDFIPVTTDATVRSAAVAGAIHHSNVVYGGSEQINTSVITITGDGSGAEGIGIIEGNRLSKITMTNVGSGYHSATIIADGDAIAEAVIEPPGGHGYDAVTELGSRFIIVSMKLEYSETGSVFTTENEYRRLGIIQDPYNFGTTTVSTGVTLSSMKSAALVDIVGGFQNDEYIEGQTSGAIAYIVDFDDNTDTIRYLNNSDTGYDAFVDGETIYGSTSGSTGTIDTLGNPDVAKHSGSILYVDNRVPMIRTVDQIDYISIVIKF